MLHGGKKYYVLVSLNRVLKIITNVERQQVWFFPFDLTGIEDKFTRKNIAG